MTLVLLCSPFAAVNVQAQVYKCVDAAGRTVYSQSPCPQGAKSSAIERRVPAAAPAPADAKGAKPAGQKSAAELDQEFRKRRQQEEEAQKKESEKAADARAKEENCRSARAQLMSLESGIRQARVNEKGERYFLDEAQIEQEKARAQQIVNSSCK